MRIAIAPASIAYGAVRRSAEESDSAALARGAEVIVLCLSDAEAVRAVLDGAGPGLRSGHLVDRRHHVRPAGTRALAESLSARGVRLVDAPVTGGPTQAEAGVLGSLVAAKLPTSTRCSGSSPAIRRRYSDGRGGSGHAAKLLNNFVTQGTVVLLAEAYTRARDSGIDWQALYAVMCAGAARSARWKRWSVRRLAATSTAASSRSATQPRTSATTARWLRARIGDQARSARRYTSALPMRRCRRRTSLREPIARSRHPGLIPGQRTRAIAGAA